MVAPAAAAGSDGLPNTGSAPEADLQAAAGVAGFEVTRPLTFNTPAAAGARRRCRGERRSHPARFVDATKRLAPVVSARKSCGC